MVVFREKHGVSLSEAENAIRGLTIPEIKAKAVQLSSQFKSIIPKGFGVDQQKTILFLRSPEAFKTLRLLGLANWLVDYFTHGNSFENVINQLPENQRAAAIKGITTIGIPSLTQPGPGGLRTIIEPDEQITTSESPFLTGGFVTVVAPALVDFISKLKTTGRTTLITKMTQILPPQFESSAKKVYLGTVGVTLLSGFPRPADLVFRAIFHDLLSNNSREQLFSFQLQPGVTRSVDWAFNVRTNRFRVELQIFTKGGSIASNVLNRTERITIEEKEKPPSVTPPGGFPPREEPFRPVPIQPPEQITMDPTKPPIEPTPEEPPTPITTGLGKFDQLVMGALILGAVLPLRVKKK